MFLLLVACISSCNKDGFTTLVIEDGQSSVAQMIIGQWTPDHVEWADEDGNVLERPEMPDIPDLNFDEGGTGTFGGNGSGSFDWTVDEGLNDGMGSGYHGEGPSITFGGERWYIFQLTKTILIIYRITDRYIIIYYYDKVYCRNRVKKNDYFFTNSTGTCRRKNISRFCPLFIGSSVTTSQI